MSSFLCQARRTNVHRLLCFVCVTASQDYRSREGAQLLSWDVSRRSLGKENRGRARSLEVPARHTRTTRAPASACRSQGSSLQSRSLVASVVIQNPSQSLAFTYRFVCLFVGLGPAHCVRHLQALSRRLQGTRLNHFRSRRDSGLPRRGGRPRTSEWDAHRRAQAQGVLTAHVHGLLDHHAGTGAAYCAWARP